MSKTQKRNLFQEKRFVILFALIAVFAWGGAFPSIKIGLQEFQIGSQDLGGKMLFAGVRFFISGLITLVIASRVEGSIRVKKRDSWLWILFFGMINTGLHYFFFYVGLSNCSGGKSSIFDSLSTFLLVILACIVFPGEHMTWRKALGCVLGFLGVLVINMGSDVSDGFHLSGEGMLFMSSICSAAGGIITRVISKKVSILTATGYSLSVGGLALILSGIAAGAKNRVITPKGILILCILVAISTVGFVLYNQLLVWNPVGEIAIFNSLIPVFGTMLSCIFLKEAFYLKYIFAILFTAAGIYSVNYTVKKQER